jgi:hypothetical protein
VAQQQAHSESGEGESAQELSAGSQREPRSAPGGKGRVGGTPFTIDGGSFMAVGILNLALSWLPSQRFHILIGIACCLSAGSFGFLVWKRSPAKAVDGIRGPAALLLSVWAIGLYGYITGSAAGDTFDRLTAGFVGTVYLLLFTVEILSEPHLLGINRTRSDR